jgi:hypothetical protein
MMSSPDPKREKWFRFPDQNVPSLLNRANTNASAMENAVEDEITSINSIYGEETLVSISQNPTLCTLRLPALPSLVLRIEFPDGYPDEPPIVTGTETVGDNAPKGSGAAFVGLAQVTLSKVYTAGTPCIFDLIEVLGADIEANAKQSPDEEIQASQSNGGVSSTQVTNLELSASTLGDEPPWTITAAITEKKSVFVGRAVPVSSPSQAKQYLQHLLATDKKAAKATHNITAWRIRGQNDTSYQDCDDDGETAAGGRVLHLMQLMDVWDVMVIVTRWYGGVLLGPDRFRIINQAAREALVSGGFAKEAESSKKKGKR